MDALQTREARLYKALDKLEAVIQHNESDISTGCRSSMNSSRPTPWKMRGVSISERTSGADLEDTLRKIEKAEGNENERLSGTGKTARKLPQF
jgi:putative hydrolase of HD superfamily